MSQFSYHQEGRRFVIDGDTRCAPKGSLGKHGVGLNFDWDAKIWWTGKEETAKAAIAKLEQFSDVKSTQATYSKLADGSWGARVPGSATAGDLITVVKRSGESKQETIAAVLSTETADDGSTVSVCSLAPRQRKASGRGVYRGRRSYSSEYCYHRCPVGGFVCCPQNGPCHDCE